MIRVTNKYMYLYMTIYDYLTIRSTNEECYDFKI